MHKSLFVLSFCAAIASTVLPQPLLASESETKPMQSAEIKPTIATGDAEAGKASSAICAGCHGANGVSAIAVNPSLAGQGASYLYKQLAEFKSGARENAVMAGMVANLSEDDMHNLAAYYAEMPAPEGTSANENLKLGASIYQGGITSVGVPACMGCHAPTGGGNDAAKFPRLGGQSAEYVATALKNFRSGARANDPGRMMQMVAARMSDAEIAAVANYVQGLH